jgi:hypothetical protein
MQCQDVSYPLVKGDLDLLPCTAHGLDEVRLGDLLAACEVASSDLRINLDPRVGRDEVFWSYCQLMCD